jgi:hypothetical protein
LLAKVAQSHALLDSRVRHRPRLRRGWHLNWPKGRPRRGLCHRPEATGAAVVRLQPHLPSVGVPLFAPWLDHQGAFAPVVAQITQAITAHQDAPPGDDLALFHHGDETLRRRFQARCFAPLGGIEPRTAFETHEPPLRSVLGRSDQGSTLPQCLGHRERVRADEALFPTRVPAQAGHITSSDGHMIASGRRVSLHKGQSPMRGRIMAGSHAAIAHHEAGHAVFVASHPPAIQVSRVIGASCHQGKEAPGRPLVVLDRAVHSLALAWAFAARDWGLRGMRDDHAPQGRERLEAPPEGPLDDGSQV